MSKRIRRSYTTEFKLQAVRQVVETDKTAAEVSREIGIGDNLLRRWCNEYEQLESLPKTEESKDDEIRRLRSELESLKEDNDILKKAAAYFAKESR